MTEEEFTGLMEKDIAKDMAEYLKAIDSPLMGPYPSLAFLSFSAMNYGDFIFRDINNQPKYPDINEIYLQKYGLDPGRSNGAWLYKSYSREGIRLKLPYGYNRFHGNERGDTLYSLGVFFNIFGDVADHYRAIELKSIRRLGKGSRIGKRHTGVLLGQYSLINGQLKYFQCFYDKIEDKNFSRTIKVKMP